MCEAAEPLRPSNQGFFLEMYFWGEIAFVGRENVKDIQKNKRNLLLFGEEI